jgi:error-prone DNA polymerase
MLPRLQPRQYYDLVVEVAIVRPGPIQGGMVHPYLKRREDLRHRALPTYFNDVIRRVLGRTLGVPIFQEQVMQLAIEAAGFSPGRPTSCGARWRHGAQGRSGKHRTRWMRR